MKIGIVITARLKSSRLPEKVTKSILGEPMIAHMLRRLKLAQRPELIVINTSTNPQDQPLIDIAIQQKVNYFCGHEDDVLLRMYDAARQYGVDVVVNCTADNPFVDPVYIDKLVDFHLAQKNDFSDLFGLPIGTASYVVNRSAIKKALAIKDKQDSEFWLGYFRKTGQFKIGTLEVREPLFYRPNLRLTVDYQQDFELMTKLFEALHSKERVFSLEEILHYLDQHPELLKINMHLKQAQEAPIKLKVKS